MKFQSPILEKLLPYYKPHLKLLASDLFCAGVVAGTDLVYPFFPKLYINDYIPNGDLQMMIIMALVFLGLCVIRMGCNYFMGYQGHVMGSRIEKDMRSDLFKHIQTLPFLFFDENRTGQIMARLMGDLAEVGELTHHCPEDLSISALMLGGSLWIMFGINSWLTFLLAGIAALLVISVLSLRKMTTDAFSGIKVKHSEINARIESCISGVRLSKSYANEEYDLERFEVNNLAYLNAWRRGHRSLGVLNAITTFLIDALTVVAIGVGGIITYFNFMNLGDLVAFLLYAAIFVSLARRLNQFANQFLEGIAGFGRFVELMNVPSTMIDSPGARDLDRPSGKIEFHDVSFKYNEHTPWILKDFNLVLEPGEIIGLIGPTGVGKTTIVHLIPRFYDVTCGEILIDGENIKDFSLQSLRRNIGIVQQDVFMFYGTIKENIVYGRPGATDEEIVEAAKKAGIYEYIMSLPDKFDAIVGERGVKLSGGQKQRISIARVFLKDPPILLLDEATSSLDTLTELQVHQSLLKLAEGRTTIIVAHRLSTIKSAKEILVLADQVIVERGTHQELMDNHGLYSQLYQAQFDEFCEIRANS
ncbi:MAG TPA: ABC transporter ATP-binding protein [Candidatus Lokiarchaeia archaeon]|nr:ABC transporter ATP-binding protein [Candidatus Lokiarchaeia archaeon]